MDHPGTTKSAVIPRQNSCNEREFFRVRLYLCMLSFFAWDIFLQLWFPYSSSCGSGKLYIYICIHLFLEERRPFSISSQANKNGHRANKHETPSVLPSPSGAIRVHHMNNLFIIYTRPSRWNTPSDLVIVKQRTCETHRNIESSKKRKQQKRQSQKQRDTIRHKKTRSRK